MLLSLLCLVASKGRKGRLQRLTPLLLLPQTVTTPLGTRCYRANNCSHHLSASDQEQPPRAALGCVCRATGSWERQRQSMTTLAVPHSSECPPPQVASNVQEAPGLRLSSCVILGKYLPSHPQQEASSGQFSSTIRASNNQFLLSLDKHLQQPHGYVVTAKVSESAGTGALKVKATSIWGEEEGPWSL